MSGVSKAVSEELYIKTIKCLQGLGKKGDVSRNLQAIKSAKEQGVSVVAKVFGVSRVTIMSWINKFKTGGVEGLKLKAGRGRKSILSGEEKNIVKMWVSNDANLTIKAVKIKIEEVFEKKLSITAIHNLIHQLNFSYITPRTKHHKQDHHLQDDFKKKSRKNLPGKS